MHSMQAAQNPAAEIDDRPHIFGDRNDVDRETVPRADDSAQQRYASRDLPDLILTSAVEQLEFFVGRLAQIRFSEIRRASTVAPFVAEETEGATVRLGAV